MKALLVFSLLVFLAVATLVGGMLITTHYGILAGAFTFFAGTTVTCIVILILTGISLRSLD